MTKKQKRRQMTNNNIKISIIVPIYNVEPYLKKCLDSLVNQTIANDIEIICINDCSPDNCLDILKEYQEKYSDRLIKIIDHKENTGVAIARNDGLAIAQGEYLGFVDPDDWVDLNFFEVLYNKGIESGADIVKGNFKKIKNGKRATISKQNKNVKENPISFIGAGWWSAIYRRGIIEKNNIDFPNIQNSEDNVFLTKCKFYANRIEVLDNVFYYYFDRKNSLTKDYSEKRISSIIEHAKIVSDFINSVNIPKDDYIYYVNYFINELIWYFDALEYIGDIFNQNNIIDAIFKLYDVCKYKREYYNKYYQNYTDFIANKDFINFKKYLSNNCYFKKSFRIFKYFVILKIKHKENKKYFYLFNFIPILKIYKEKNFITHYKLFDLITLLTIKNN